MAKADWEYRLQKRFNVYEDKELNSVVPYRPVQMKASEAESRWTLKKCRNKSIQCSILEAFIELSMKVNGLMFVNEFTLVPS